MVHFAGEGAGAWSILRIVDSPFGGDLTDGGSL